MQTPRGIGNRLATVWWVAFLGLVFLGLLALGVAASSSSSSASSSSTSSGLAPSPAADLELICHTDNPSECYPRIFQPTDEFQVVHEDQDLPPGLHVRLNIYTGLKEAKINVPDEGNSALEGLPVDSSIVVVEPEQAEPEAAKFREGAPEYDPVGKIKTPPDESSAFYKNLAVLKKGLGVDDALEMLEDISHDIYYGLKIAEDYDTVKELFCLANTGDIFTADVEQPVLDRARLAALTIASSVQNNPKALDEIEKHWATLQREQCPKSSEPLGTATFRLTSPTSQSKGVAGEALAALAKVRVSAIHGLLKNDQIRKDFLAHEGMDLLLEVLAGNDKPEWEPAQRKVSLLVLDNFLDENMGAALGEWPTGEQLNDKLCEEKSEITGMCWDWHAKKLAERHRRDKNHWSGELWKKLQEQRKINAGNQKSRQRDEL